MIAVLNDWSSPIGIDMVNIMTVPGSHYQPVTDGRTGEPIDIISNPNQYRASRNKDTADQA